MESNAKQTLCFAAFQRMKENNKAITVECVMITTVCKMVKLSVSVYCYILCPIFLFFQQGLHIQYSSSNCGTGLLKTVYLPLWKFR